MVPAIRSAARLHPDAARIAGLAGAITINMTLLLLLLTPIRMPLSQPHPAGAPACLIRGEKPPACRRATTWAREPKCCSQ